MSITCREYWAEIKSIAAALVKESMADNDNDKEAAIYNINDNRLHETIDGHAWIIYCSYNLEVLSHSDNEGYMSSNFGGKSLAAALDEGGYRGLNTALAFWAMYADVQDDMETAWSDFESTIEEE